MHDYEVPISYGMTTSGDRIEKKINEMNSKLSPLEDLRRIADAAENPNEKHAKSRAGILSNHSDNFFLIQLPLLSAHRLP